MALLWQAPTDRAILLTGDKLVNKKIQNGIVVAGVSILVAACGSGGVDSPSMSVAIDDSGARGSLYQNPPLRIASLTADQFKGSLNASPTGQNLLAIAGTPKCGIDVQYLHYGTVEVTYDAALSATEKPTTATGALMVPTGSDPSCTGARPELLYGHGTTVEKRYNLASFGDNTNPAYSEAVMLAAMYAAQGYIVVAPNYAGYDASTLSYHPYLNADQQSKDMIDALAAAKKAMPNLLNPVTPSTKLFIAGYSQGGHVAMATHRALQVAGVTVTASAPMSGPYAMAAFGDAVYYGNVNLGSTLFAPLLSASYQKAYGNIYSATTDLYENAFAGGIESLLPGSLTTAGLFQNGKLPQTALFSSTPPVTGSASTDAMLAAITPPTTPAAQAPLFAMGFGQLNLIKNSARMAYLSDAMARPDGLVPSPTTGVPAAAPQHPMRIAAKANDLRNWLPTSPVLLCGGKNDPTVFFSVNTLGIKGYFDNQSPQNLTTVLDLDSTPAGPFATAMGGFAQAKAATATAAVTAGATDGGVSAVTQAYHGSLVPPFCNAAARGFFSTL